MLNRTAKIARIVALSLGLAALVPSVGHTQAPPMDMSWGIRAQMQYQAQGDAAARATATRDPRCRRESPTSRSARASTPPIRPARRTTRRSSTTRSAGAIPLTTTTCGRFAAAHASSTNTGAWATRVASRPVTRATSRRADGQGTRDWPSTTRDGPSHTAATSPAGRRVPYRARGIWGGNREKAMSSGLREASMASADPNRLDGRFSRTVVGLSTVFTRLGALLFTGLHFYDLVADGAYSRLAVVVVIVVPSMAIAAWLLLRPRRAQCIFGMRRFIGMLPLRSSADEDR